MNDEQLIDDALHAARDTKHFMLSAGALKDCVNVFEKAFGARAAVVIADSNTFNAAGRQVIDALKRANHPALEPFIITDPNLYAEHTFVEQLEASLAKHDAIPVAVGSGTINDLVKLASHRTGRRYMCVATAASMDGYTAYGASITFKGSKQTFDCPAPLAVVADLDVIANAPAEMNAWGYADLLAKITAGADWIVADELRVEPIDRQAWRMVQENLRAWVGNPRGIGSRDPQAIGSLVCGLMMGGFAMQATCSSRCASGAEHQFSHLWDMEHHSNNGKTVSHGAKVGVATVAVARFYEKLFAHDGEGICPTALSEQWPEENQIEKQIAALYDVPEITEKALLETRAKKIDREQLLRQLELLRRRWPKLKQRVREHLLSANELAQMLADAGAPKRCEQIGISRDRMVKSFRRAYYIRRRFTVLDLAERMGMLDELAKSSVDQHGQQS
jgi:glycerol-1-phosphate dehydrogenase [NAD(P)+]